MRADVELAAIDWAELPKAVVADPSLIDDLERTGRIAIEDAAELRRRHAQGQLAEIAVADVLYRAGRVLFGKAVKRAGGKVDDPVGARLARTLTFVAPRAPSASGAPAVAIRVAPKARGSARRPRRRRNANRRRSPGRDTGGDEPPPPSERPCGYCGADLTGERSNKHYCSESHKVMASQRRARERDREALAAGIDEEIGAAVPAEFWLAEEAVLDQVRRGEECPELALDRVNQAFARVAA